MGIVLSAGLANASDQNPVFKDLYKDFGGLEQKLQAEKAQFELLRKSAEVQSAEIQGKELLLRNVEEEKTKAMQEFKEIKKKLNTTTTQLSTIKNKEKKQIEERAARENKRDLSRRRFDTTESSYKKPVQSQLKTDRAAKEMQEVQEYLKKEIVDLQQVLREKEFLVNRLKEKEILEFNKLEKLRADLAELIKKRADQGEMVSGLEGSGRSAKKKFEYGKYTLEKQYPELVKLYEPKPEPAVPLTFFQRLMQKPTTWYRQYAQQVRQKEVDVLNKGEALSKRRLPSALVPAFVPRLTEAERAKRLEELKSSKAYQQSPFNPEQENIGGTGASPQFAIKAAEKLRNWYSQWRMPGRKVSVGPSNFIQPLLLN